VVPQTFSHRLMAQEPIKTSSGTVRISDSRNFPINTTTAAALVEINPVGLREMHWHPNADVALRHGALHREYRYHAVALSGDVQEHYYGRFVAGHMAGADSAGIAAGASEARSASGGRVAYEQDADRAGLSGHSVIPTKGLGTAVGRRGEESMSMEGIGLPAARFGIFDHLDHAGGSLRQQYSDRLKIAAAADEAGFLTYHVG